MNTLEKIVSDTGMSVRPEYYSGYGANDQDLGAKRLILIHSKIKEQFGTEASASYVQMVRKLSTLAATVFLQALYRLGANGWKLSGDNDPTRIAVEPRGKTTDEMALMLMAGIFTQQNVNPVSDKIGTETMRNEFLRSIGEQPPRNNPYDIDRIYREIQNENFRRYRQGGNR